MITLYNGPIPQSVIGCRIKTLCDCYRDIPNTVDLYTDGTAVICRFENTLLATENSDISQLISFADMLGISEIELEGGKTPQIDGWDSVSHPVLYRDCVGDAKVPFLPSLKECFEVIAASDEDFAQKANYLYWLSDINRRQNRGCAKAYCQNGAAATVSAVTESSAYLSSVAVRPESRNQGRASQLLKLICSDKMLSGKRVYTAAQNEAVAKLYLKNGFFPLEKSVITLKRSKY